MRQQIIHPVQLSSQEKAKLLDDFKKAMLKADIATDRDERVTAFLRFSSSLQEIGIALYGVKHTKKLNKAFCIWYKLGLEVEKLMK